MKLETFYDLLTQEGQQALQAAETLKPLEVDYLRHFQRLSKSFTHELARAAIETAILRIKAVDKFPKLIASHMYFTKEALEQATSFEISSYRSKRYREQFSPEMIIDLGCSIGGDTLAFACVAPCIGIDQDELRLVMGRANIAELSQLSGYPEVKKVDFVRADLTESLPIRSRTSIALFFDPSRRTDHRRIFSVNNYQPPLHSVHEWLSNFTALSVKLSPGVNLKELSGYHAEIEFISLNGELKECMLWFGAMRTATRRATLLPGRAQMSIDLVNSQSSRLPITDTPQNYLYEPDPAILRAGLVRQLAEQIGAAQLDPEIAYLTNRDLSPTPFARVWLIEDWLPFNLKRLRSYLKQRNVGKVTVKKRGSPLEPQALIRNLRLKGDLERVIVLTHLRGDPIVVVCLPPTP